jgi:cytochrome d ubiquinol oxidase subunit I
MVTEIGRQPWIATGVLRTADAASPVIAQSVLGSLIGFILDYAIVFSTGIYAINRLINKGPTPSVVAARTGTPSRPLAAGTGALGDAAGEGL